MKSKSKMNPFYRKWTPGDHNLGVIAEERTCYE